MNVQTPLILTTLHFYLYYILLAIETLLVVRILSLLFSPFWYSYFANQNCTCSRPQNEEFVYIFSNSRCSTNSVPKAKSDVYDCLFLLKFAFFKIGKIPLFQFRARVDFSDATDINKPVLSLIRRLSTLRCPLFWRRRQISVDICCPRSSCGKPAARRCCSRPTGQTDGQKDGHRTVIYRHVDAYSWKRTASIIINKSVCCSTQLLSVLYCICRLQVAFFVLERTLIHNSAAVHSHALVTECVNLLTDFCSSNISVFC